MVFVSTSPDTSIPFALVSPVAALTAFTAPGSPVADIRNTKKRKHYNCVNIEGFFIEEQIEKVLHDEIILLLRLLFNLTTLSIKIILDATKADRVISKYQKEFLLECILDRSLWWKFRI